MSRYVQRCLGRHCGNRVLGKTSFRSLGAGVRATQCRFCDDGDRQVEKLKRERLAPIDRKISELRMRLGHLLKRRLAVSIELERAS